MEQAQAAKTKTEAAIAEIVRMNTEGPDNSTLTLIQMEEREARRRSMAVTARIAGVKIKKGYR
jgi:hypothetical protein